MWFADRRSREIKRDLNNILCWYQSRQVLWYHLFRLAKNNNDRSYDRHMDLTLTLLDGELNKKKPAQSLIFLLIPFSACSAGLPAHSFSGAHWHHCLLYGSCCVSRQFSSPLISPSSRVPAAKWLSPLSFSRPCDSLVWLSDFPPTASALLCFIWGGFWWKGRVSSFSKAPQTHSRAHWLWWVTWRGEGGKHVEQLNDNFSCW